MRRTVKGCGGEDPDVVRVAEVVHHLIDEMDRWGRPGGAVFGRDRPSARLYTRIASDLTGIDHLAEIVSV